MLHAFSKHSFSNIMIVSNGLDPGQDRRSFCLDLGPNFLKGYQEITLSASSN